MRYLIDTHIFIWYAREKYKLTSDVLAIIDDYENDICISSESLKELVQLWNKKPPFGRICNPPARI
jgi:PIN domain nuclease of toxin-antitoxin system